MNSNTPFPSRRKVVFVPETIVAFTIFSEGDIVHICRTSSLPETARLRGVHYDPVRLAFGFVLEDQSFEVVPEGAQTPEAVMTWEMTKVPLLPPVPTEDSNQTKLSLG